MTAFIKNYNIDIIKKKLILLYALNVTDIIFTILLLSTGLYMEANTLMVEVVKNPISSFSLKVLLPAALLLYLYIRIQKASENQLKKSNIILNIATMVYIFINISHLICFAILPILVIFI